MNKLSQMNVIQVKDLGKTVATLDGDLTILSGISFNVKPGESIAIVGASGSGKSTLLALLAGLDSVTKGEIYLDGEPLHNLDEEQRAVVRAKLVGFVFQSFQLLDSLTALENVALPLELARDNQAQQKAKHFLEKVGLQQRLKHYPRQLSGGEQQRVAIARAFSCQPKILFADEPTGNLDQATGTMVSDLLFELNAQSDTTLVLVTHEARLAERCQQRIRIDAGKVFFDV